MDASEWPGLALIGTRAHTSPEQHTTNQSVKFEGSRESPIPSSPGLKKKPYLSKSKAVKVVKKSNGTMLSLQKLLVKGKNVPIERPMTK